MLVLMGQKGLNVGHVVSMEVGVGLRKLGRVFMGDYVYRRGGGQVVFCLVKKRDR